MSLPPEPARQARWRSNLRLAGKAALALPVLALWTWFFYAGVTRGASVISDGWVLLGIGALGLAKAPFVLLSYHTIPVTNAFTAILWRICGVREGWYQLINLGELVLVGWGLYLFAVGSLGRRLALLSALLFLAHPGFYEVPLWPLVGNFQSLAAALCLAALAAARRSAATRAAGDGSGGVATAAAYFACTLLAFFTYEPTVSLVPAGVAAALLWGGRAGEEGQSFWASFRPRLAAARPVLLAAAGLCAVVAGSKLWSSAHGYQAAYFPKTLWELGYRLYLLVRGVLSIFTVTGSDDTLYTLMTLGLRPAFDSLAMRLCVVGWLLVMAGAACWILWFGRPLERLLTIWIAAHLGLTAAATGLVSRHYYIAALAACPLLVLMLERWATAAVGLWQGLDAPATPTAGTRRLAVGTATALAIALLVARGKTDLDAAQSLYLEASRASRAVRAHLVQHFAQRNPETHALLLDMPASLSRSGVAIMPFVNGLHQLAQLAAGVGPEALTLASAGGPFVDGLVANGSPQMSVRELLPHIADPNWRVLAFDPSERAIRRLDPDTFKIPLRYSPTAVPFLRWLREPDLGEWMFTVSGALDLPLATPACGASVAAASCRVRILLLAEPGREAELRVGDELVSLGSADIEIPAWREIVLPASAEPVTWVHLEQRGKSPLLLRRLEVIN
jgi:hypothetical protein